MPGMPPKWSGDPRTKIRLIAVTNPKRRWSKSSDRYALYQTGMTVAEYVEACKETPSPQYALNDISWDWERGFIELLKP
jgi:hypothetical protein